jgi:lysophospholipase L1-like esterase
MVSVAGPWLRRPLAAEPFVRPGPGGWSLRDGDRVVFLGDTFFERDGALGIVEAALVASHPESRITVRNLGWSGDTVWAESRGVFDPPAKGYERMIALLRTLEPTLVFVAYGRNESLRGPGGLQAFRDQYAKLCADLRATGERVRLVLVTPHPDETADSAARNAALAPYAQAVRDVAREQAAGLVDLFAAWPTAASRSRTENGVHLSDAGYEEAARAFVTAAGRTLPADFAAFAPELRRRIGAKNTLFFHRWRPANETYIFLFRKHEQGNNAVEMPQFDPLVEQAEDAVRALAKGGR